MANFALVVHPHRLPARKVAGELVAWLQAEGHDVRLPGADARYGGLEHLECSDTEAGDADLIVSLGGDGSILRAVRLATADENRPATPVLGVNFGQLAYLAEVEPDDARAAVERWLTGDFRIDERMRLAVRVRTAGSTAGEFLPVPGALNEAVVEKVDRGHSARLALSVDGRAFSAYRADGLIVASPTGSTAYSLSAGGPIVAPNHPALLVTPVCPHSLFDRALVLPPDSVIRIEVQGERPAALALDGDIRRVLQPGSVVECEASPFPACLVTFGYRKFHDILTAKFGLGDG